MSEAEIQEQIGGHRQRNREILRTLRERGTSLDLEVDAEHHFWATSQAAAAQLAKALYQQGFLVIALSAVRGDDGSIAWNVEGQRKQTLSEAASPETVERLVRLADDFEALYDGWGASV